MPEMSVIANKETKPVLRIVGQTLKHADRLIERYAPELPSRFTHDSKEEAERLIERMKAFLDLLESKGLGSTCPVPIRGVKRTDDYRSDPFYRLARWLNRCAVLLDVAVDDLQKSTDPEVIDAVSEIEDDLWDLQDAVDKLSNAYASSKTDSDFEAEMTAACPDQGS